LTGPSLPRVAKSPMFQNTCFRCFICLKGMLECFIRMLQSRSVMLHMLQWLYIYIASFYSQCFICFFRRMLQVCLSGCCICFTHMLQVFYLDVVYVYNSFKCISGVFANV
jgi:hypothetical protein